MSGLSLTLPPEMLEQLAQRVAGILEERQLSSSPPGRWLTVAEAAEILRRSPQRIRDLRSARRLTPYREGGRALVDRLELERLVEGV